MFVLISGGSESGKSAFAEDLVSRLAEADAAERRRRSGRASEIRKIYLATMQNDSAEAAARIEKHRAARAGRDFVTVECPDLSPAWDDLWKSCGISGRKVSEASMLLEDLPNLLANRMFSGGLPAAAWQVVDPAAGELVEGSDEAKMGEMLAKSAAMLSLQMWIAGLRNACANLVVVTDELFSDGGGYGASTNWYLMMLGFLHRAFAAEADAVVEVVCGIPVIRKGKELPCFSGRC